MQTNSPNTPEQVVVNPLERWPGYNEQSWLERFIELEQRYEEVRRQLIAALASLPPQQPSERAQIVAWLRKGPHKGDLVWATDAIERGDYLPQQQAPDSEGGGQ